MWVHWAPLVAGKTVPYVKERGKMPQVAPLEMPTGAHVYVPATMPMRCVPLQAVGRGGPVMPHMWHQPATYPNRRENYSDLKTGKRPKTQEKIRFFRKHI